ncbi:hypothetical protein SESBI_01990 [Sesbania bispinosa]|nr:hypothetical protein SESBI_01990 [Sesbania bispinosa]
MIHHSSSKEFCLPKVKATENRSGSNNIIENPNKEKEKREGERKPPPTANGRRDTTACCWSRRQAQPFLRPPSKSSRGLRRAFRSFPFCAVVAQQPRPTPRVSSPQAAVRGRVLSCVRQLRRCCKLPWLPLFAFPLP